MIRIKRELAGRFKLEVYKDSELQRGTGWFDNLITDSGLDGIAARRMFLSCWVGTGSATPSTGDTALQTFLVGTSSVFSSSNTAQGSAPYYGSSTVTFAFAAGAAEGNISEVGIASGPVVSGNHLFSRALVLDGMGDPTTITVLADEELRVTYELRCYPPLADVDTTETINSISTDVTVRAAKVTDATTWGTFLGYIVGGPQSSAMQVYTGAIGAITSIPSTQLAEVTPTAGVYTPGSFEVEIEGIYGTSVVGTITALMFSTNYGAYQVSFDPGIVKTNLQSLTMTMLFTWARKTL